MLVPAPPPALLRTPPLLLPPAPLPPEVELRVALPTPAEPYRWPDLSVGDPNAPDPLRGLPWPELRALIYEPDAAPPPAPLPLPPAPLPPDSVPEAP